MSEKCPGASYTRCLRGVWEASGRRPGASGRRPGAVREASGTRPKSVRNVIERRLCQKRARELKKCETARGVRRFRPKTIRFSSVFDDFIDERFFCTGTMVLHDFTKNTAPVQKVQKRRACAQKWRRSVQKCTFRSSFDSEKCVFAAPVQ